MEQMPTTKSVYNKERYEQSKEEILKICLHNMMMYLITGKQKCIRCDELKNLLHEKGTQYN